MKNEDTKYSDQVEQVDENEINISKIVEEFVVSGMDTIEKFITDLANLGRVKKDEKGDN
jgi:hypothetical protein|tara:strand:- start:391 stop:567 length:177 start_codon:yes stop_codon:yes gene_type:complete